MLHIKNTLKEQQKQEKKLNSTRHPSQPPQSSSLSIT